LTDALGYDHLVRPAPLQARQKLAEIMKEPHQTFIRTIDDSLQPQAHGRSESSYRPGVAASLQDPREGVLGIMTDTGKD
jgi:hypothetical protein